MQHTLAPGSAVYVAGFLPAGSYDLCVVPNGVYSVGDSYSGDRIRCTRMLAERGSMPETMIWAAARAGAYDLLAFEANALDTIVTGDDLGEAAGLMVQVTVPAPRSPWLLPALLACMAAFALHERRGRNRGRGGSVR